MWGGASQLQAGDVTDFRCVSWGPIMPWRCTMDTERKGTGTQHVC